MGLSLYFFVFKVTDSNSPKSIAKQYVNNILSSNYNENYSLLSVPENNFVDSNDYVEYVQTLEKYQDLKGMKIDSINESFISEKSAKYNFKLSNDKEINKNIIIELKFTKDWKVIENGLYIENWEVIIPKGTDLYINNMKVNEKLISDDTSIDKNLNKFIIPAISMVKKKFKLDNPIQKKDIDITPLSSNSGEIIDLELNNQGLVDKAQKYIMTTWNNMYQDYLNNTNVSDVANKYFDKSIDVNTINSYYKTAFDSLTEGSSGYKDINFNLVEVINSKNSNYVLNNDLIEINFGYKLTWNWTLIKSYVETMTRYSKITLKLDGDSFKIYEVPDIDLFAECNGFINDF